jgi:hypothetical protein
MLTLSDRAEISGGLAEGRLHENAALLDGVHYFPGDRLSLSRRRHHGIDRPSA